jgi:YgiT-type zinc finger domain-containing protein
MSLIKNSGLVTESGRQTHRRITFMKETIVETTVTYTIEHEGKFYIVENVPARVCKETGEQFFSPETVEHLQQTIKGKKKPVRLIETPVFNYG